MSEIPIDAPLEDQRPDYVSAVLAQRQAAHPAHTRLVSANAGSGKTRVLVDRVSRLLLSGTDPEKILCLTYTKAAASEMQSRLFDTLGEWSVMPESALETKLAGLLGAGHDLPDFRTARALFAKALETPDGLKVQTIHAFCERILSRFPIEAGILPGFEPLEDSDVRALQARVKEDILRSAAQNPDGDLDAALQKLSVDKAEQTIDGLFEWMSFNGAKIEHWTEHGLDPLAEYLGIDIDATEDSIGTQAWTEFDPKTRRSMAARLGESPSVTDQKISTAMMRAFSAASNADAFLTYANAFMTTGGTLRKKLTTAKADRPVADFFAIDGPEVSRVMTGLQDMLSARCLEMTRAVYVLAQDYAKRFKDFKRFDRRLDFSDQIILVKDLLNHSEASEWVRYKLDGGIEHILLDEAQDTAPAQWDIIDALAAPFFQDSPDRNQHTPRTLFAVGDEKQSIYSFQGAEPERFLSKIQHYTSDENPFVQNAKQIRMRMSFRSAPDVLRFVDQVFVDNHGRQRMFDAEHYAPASDTDRHTAHRADKGRVEFWPLAMRPEIEDENEAWDTRPVNALSMGDQREQLAVAIAAKIKHWLAIGEPVFDRKLGATRPIVPRDILILVRQRNAFFDAIIRNLKSEGVAVAGADRLKLKESIAVQDLLALARFVLLPSDDLSLAEVLKSPLFGFDEDALYSVASERHSESLWQTLQTRRPKVYQQLAEMINHARRFAPYEFFARVLSTLNDDCVSLTQRLYQRLGMEAKDALEAFLSIALAHQRHNAPSLQHFVQRFSEDDPVLKRDMDSASDAVGQVRVMTVHGAKGLEAPIVFLPDTTQTPTTRGQLTEIEGGGFVLAGSKARRPATLEPFIEADKARDMQEYMRLLYVAMTRAESRLIICGYQDGRIKLGYSEGAWYDEIKQAIAGLDTEIIETPFGDGLAYGAGAAPVSIHAKNDNFEKSIPLPDWARSAADPEGLPYRRVTPSHLLVSESDVSVPTRSPLTRAVDTRFERGLLIHKLLEILPEVEVSHQEDIGRRFIQSRAPSYGADAVQDILTEVLNILRAPEFAEIFGKGSKAEVSLAGRAKSLPETLYLNGQIDRLCVTDSHVYIVDYKSNRPPPKSQAAIAPLYTAQMAAYRELAREIYPNHVIKCALLWTDGPDLMVLDDFRLDEALTKVRGLLT